MRQTIAARLQFGIGHSLAGGRHDEGGLKRTEMSMLAGVHRVSNLSCSQNKNFAYLRGRIDLARIARDPRRSHRLLRNRLEMLGTYPHILQAVRQSEAADEAVQDV